MVATHDSKNVVHSYKLGNMIINLITILPQHLYL